MWKVSWLLFRHLVTSVSSKIPAHKTLFQYHRMLAPGRRESHPSPNPPGHRIHYRIARLTDIQFILSPPQKIWRYILLSRRN